MWKWYDPMCRHWCLGSRNSSKHNGNDFIIVTSVFLAADSKVKWWCWCSTSTQPLNTKPTSVQTGNLYAHNVLQRTGLGQNSPPKSHYYAVQTFEIVQQRWCPEKGLQLRHVLGFCYWAVQITSSSSPLSTGLIASVQNASLLVELSQTTEMPTIRYLLI